MKMTKAEFKELAAVFKLLTDLHTSGQIPVNIVYYKLPNGELDYICEYTDDLDKIYDWYLSKPGNN